MNIVRRERVDDSSLQEVISNPVIRQILAARGLKTAADIDSSLQGLIPPFSLCDIEKASTRIAQAIMAQEKVFISGDYDVDGMSGTTLGLFAMHMLGLPKENLHYHVPSRYVDGYGVSTMAIDEAAAFGATLIITVDTGITAIDAVEYARSKGIEVVVTDHHEVQEQLPQAVAVVDPKRKDDLFPSKTLCGCGVLFYVMAATRAQLIKEGYYKDKSKPPLHELLDLVALGTIGDMMEIDANNRRLLKAGLERIHRNARGNLGLKALIKCANLKMSEVSGHAIAFDICPRLNAATRIFLENNPAMSTLLSTSTQEAHFYAHELDCCNRRRIDHEKVMLSRAVELYREDQKARAKRRTEVLGLSAAAQESSPLKKSKSKKSKLAESKPVVESTSRVPVPLEKDYGIVLFEPTFLNGIVGLVANRLRERFNVPCLVFGADLGAGKEGGYKMMKDAAAESKEGVSPVSLSEIREQKIQEYYSEDCKEVVVGSARSCTGIDLMEVFALIKEKDPDIFVACGGHAMAAGASVRACDIPRFRELFNEACCELTVQAEPKEKDTAIITDGPLPDSCMDLAFALQLEQLGPWGKGYEEPCFDGVFLIEQVSLVGKNHLRFKLVTEDGTRCDAMRFRANQDLRELQAGESIRMVFTVTVDRYFTERLQLIASKIERVNKEDILEEKKGA